MSRESKGDATELVISIVPASVFVGDQINELCGVKISNTFAELGFKLHGKATR
jgi:hypothetical protein